MRSCIHIVLKLHLPLKGAHFALGVDMRVASPARGA